MAKQFDDKKHIIAYANHLIKLGEMFIDDNSVSQYSFRYSPTPPAPLWEKPSEHLDESE